MNINQSGALHVAEPSGEARLIIFKRDCNMTNNKRAYAAQNAALRADNTSGYKNIRFRRGKYHVHVCGTYIGIREKLEDAIELRDKERKRVFPEEVR